MNIWQEEFDYLSCLLLGKYGHPTRPLGNLRMCLVGQLRGRNEGATNDEPQKKKQKMSHFIFYWSKQLLIWSKPQLQKTYLAEHNANKTENKPELIERVKACMHS